MTSREPAAVVAQQGRRARFAAVGRGLAAVDEQEVVVPVAVVVEGDDDAAAQGLDHEEVAAGAVAVSEVDSPGVRRVDEPDSGARRRFLGGSAERRQGDQGENHGSRTGSPAR